MPKYLLFWWKEEGKASKKQKSDSFQYIAFSPKVKTSAFFLCDEGVRVEGNGLEWKIAIGNKPVFALYNEAFPSPISLILKSMWRSHDEGNTLSWYLNSLAYILGSFIFLWKNPYETISPLLEYRLRDTLDWMLPYFSSRAVLPATRTSYFASNSHRTTRRFDRNSQRTRSNFNGNY